MPPADHVAAFRAAFERAARERPGEVHESSHHVGGRHLRARVVGADLAAVLQRPLLAADGAGPVALRLDLWEGELGIDAGRLGGDGVAYEIHGPGDERLGLTEGGPFVRFAASDFALWLDRRTGHAVGWVRDAARLSPWHVYRPWQALMAPWLAAAGARVFHAAMVARGERGVVVAGANHAGKSTTALACLRAGLDVLADDVVAIDGPAGAPLGHSVYGVIKSRWRPIDLDGPVLEVRDPFGAPEYVLFLNAVAPAQLRPSARIAALAIPRLVDTAESGWSPASRRAGLAALLATDLSAELGQVGEAFAAASAIADAVPVVELRIGRAPDGIAQAVDDLLERT
jgi:hypothetical protein